MDDLRFQASIRYWRPEQPGGLAVAEIPAELVALLGGRKQQRVRGTINDAAFASSVMPAGGGRLALSVSKAMMAAGATTVGDTAAFVITGVGRE